MNITIIIMMNSMSFHVKYGWNGDLSMLGFLLMGFEEPVMCSAIRCIITIKVRMNGNRKCSMKNRDKVAWLIENPPHNHCTIVFPR
jgi:hypothetical protein